MIQDVDKWIAELKAAGWKRHATISTIWISPWGAWYRGPHKAWQNIGGAREHDETTFNEIDNKLEQILGPAEKPINTSRTCTSALDYKTDGDGNPVVLECNRLRDHRGAHRGKYAEEVIRWK